jgi:hypothetical protein
MAVVAFYSPSSPFSVFLVFTPPRRALRVLLHVIQRILDVLRMSYLFVCHKYMVVGGFLLWLTYFFAIVSFGLQIFCPSPDNGYYYYYYYYLPRTLILQPFIEYLAQIKKSVVQTGRARKLFFFILWYSCGRQSKYQLPGRRCRQ